MPLERVLFICIGNSCRSQMAEGFARTYGSDILIAKSAGLAPATAISPLTYKMMSEKNIDLREHFPKDLGILSAEKFDLLVNMSGHKVPLKTDVPIEVWEVLDPIGERESVFREVCTQIEGLVVKLIIEMRARRQAQPQPKSNLSAREQRILSRGKIGKGTAI